MVKSEKPVPPQLQKLFDRITAVGKTRAGVLKECNLANSTFNDWRDGSVPSFDRLDKVLAAVYWTRKDYDGDTSEAGIRLTPAFEILGGEMFEPARGKPKEVSLALFDADLVSLEVTTNDYYPRYRLGDIVSGPRQEKNFHNLVGVDCVAEGRDGRRYFKILGKRDPKGRFTLKSFDPNEKEIEGVEIKWIAPIKMIYRP